VRVRRLLLAAIPLLLAGCAASDPGGDAPAKTAATQQRRYQATGMVLQSRNHGPELCLGGIATSFPPGCDGLPIPNWHWDQVEGEQAAGGTTWGSYQLVGTYDGASFTVIRRSERYLEPVDRVARAAPDFAGLWLSYLAPMGNNVAEDPGSSC
jgi:hypothetical protein